MTNATTGSLFLWNGYLLRVRLKGRLCWLYVSLLMPSHNLLSVQKMKIQPTFQVALVIETVTSVSITGKFETLGSNFSQEIRKAKLLASIATAPKVRCILILLKAENSLFMKFTSFTLLEVVDKFLVFLYLMYANRFHNVVPN